MNFAAIWAQFNWLFEHITASLFTSLEIIHIVNEQLSLNDVVNRMNTF